MSVGQITAEPIRNDLKASRAEMRAKVAYLMEKVGLYSKRMSGLGQLTYSIPNSAAVFSPVRCPQKHVLGTVQINSLPSTDLVYR